MLSGRNAHKELFEGGKEVKLLMQREGQESIKEENTLTARMPCPVCLLVKAQSQLSHERRVSSSVFMVTPKIGFATYTIEV